LGCKGENKDLADSEGKAGEVFNDPGKKENDGKGGSKSKLETYIKQAKGIENKKDNGADGDRVDEVDIPPDEFPQEKCHSHYCSPHYRWPAFHQKGIKNEKENHEQIREACGHSRKLQKREKKEGNNCNMSSRNSKKMINSRLLERLGDRRIHS
jgi:hypothetical protein